MNDCRYALQAILGRRWRAIDQRHSYEVEWDDASLGWVGGDEVYDSAVEVSLFCSQVFSFVRSSTTNFF